MAPHKLIFLGLHRAAGLAPLHSANCLREWLERRRFGDRSGRT
jgi:hypothetical protein